MAKLKLDGGAIKGFFALHVEKFVLAIVVLVLVFFVYRGYSIEGMEKTPDDLAQLSERATESMEKPTWSLVAADYTPKKGYPDRVEKSKMPIEPGIYKPVRTWEPPRARPGLKRSDPELFPPENLEVYAVTGPLAHRMKRGDTDLLADLTNWGELSEEELAAEQRKREREAKKKRRGGGGSSGYGEEGGYPGMGGFDDEEGGGGDSSGMGMPGMGGMGMPGMGDEGGYPGMGGYGGMPGAGVSTMADASLWPGFRAGPGAIGREAHIVAVKAVVPYQRQWDEFEQKLSMAVGYSPMRDEPSYVMFFAQRVDVTDDPTKEPAESDWKTASSTDYVLQTVVKDWYGRTTEIADPRYVSSKLTMPIPPLMARELDPLALHADVPRRQAALAMRKPAVGDEEDGEKTDEPADDGEISDVPTAPGARPGAGGYPGMGGGMYPGMGGGYPGMAGGDSSGMGGGMYPGMGEGMYPGMGEGYGEVGDDEDYGSEGYGEEGYPGMGGGDSSGMGMGMYPGMGGGGYPGMGGGAGMPSRGPKAEFLLVRFYDLRVAPGRKYRYRIQVLLQDPNHPQNQRMDPKERTLDDTVKVRLNQVEAEEAKADGTRIYYRRSEWSDPSEVVTVEIPDTTLAGEVQLPSAARAIAESPNGRFMVTQSGPTGKLISVAWDPALAIDVPGPMDVRRGSVLNFSADAAVVHPIRMIYKERPEFAFDTNSVVLDFRGGETLPVTPGEDPRREEDPLKAPGEYVLLDKTGQLYVRNELDDLDAFKRYSPPEPPEPAARGMGYPGGDYPGMDDGGYGDEGYPGMEGGGGYPGMPGAGGSGGTRRGRR